MLSWVGIFIDLIASDVKTELFTASLQTWATFERPRNIIEFVVKTI